jgi:hypothetical protein
MGAILSFFRGPPNSGKGGYVCGMLARHIAGAVEVSLRAPPPLETELGVVEVRGGQWELRQGEPNISDRAGDHARHQSARTGA